MPTESYGNFGLTAALSTPGRAIAARSREGGRVGEHGG